MPLEPFLQRHFANLRHIRGFFRIDPRTGRGTGLIAPWLSGIVQLFHPVFPQIFFYHEPEIRTLANPAAAANWQFVVTANQGWRVQALRFILATDANAANRFVQVTVDDGVNEIFRIPTVSAQTASQIRVYSYGLGLGYQAELDNQRVHGWPNLFIDQSFRIQSLVTNMQAGDQLSAIFIRIDPFPR